MSMRKFFFSVFILISCFLSSVCSTQHLLQQGRKQPRKSNELTILTASNIIPVNDQKKETIPAVVTVNRSPSIYWAILHNFLYFLCLGMNGVNMAFNVRKIINGNMNPSPESIALSGNVEAIDKLFTFLGVGFLCALSDVKGRKPLMAWSALGFSLTNLIQATAKSRVHLYLADFIDGCSSCMTPVCQAYIVDCSSSENRAANLGLFQGVSAGGAFMIAFPLGGLLGTKFGPHVPLLLSAGIQLLNFLLITFITPESNNRVIRKEEIKLDLSDANPIGSLRRLFANSATLRGMAITFFLLSLAKCSLDAQFVNYASIRFGWSSKQSGPVLVLVGLMLAIAPRLLVPILGINQAILYGLLIFAAGLTGTGLAPSPLGFIAGIFVVSVGCMSIPALQAYLVEMTKESERGALLGALSSLNELTSALGHAMYSNILAYFTSTNCPVNIPGMHFIVGAGLLLMGWLSSFITILGTNLKN